MVVVRVFDWADYLVFAGMLLVSVLIGVYHGCSHRFNKNSSGPKSGEFLTANGQLGTWPVAVSTLASFLSSITLMGQPAEVYLHGPQLWVFGVAIFAALPVVGYIFIPLYDRLKLTSAYEYLGQRYNRKVQLLASMLFTFQMVLYLALVLYAPALALYQVTGLNTETIVSIMYIVVIFYTTVGGIKAVVWTDCFQVLFLFVALGTILAKGTLDIGGLAVVWQRNAQSNRTTFFNWNMDPTERYTLWSTFIGAAVLHCASYGTNQLQVQRYRAVSTVQKARNILWLNAVGWTVVVLATVSMGMLIFAKYYECDPLSTGIIRKPDQLFPLFVMDTLGDYQGFPGLFVAGIFSAGLSTVSTGLNSLAAIWFAELDGTKFKDALSETRAALAVKLLALIFGLLSFALVFLVPYMSGLIPVAVSLTSFFSGSLLAVFLLGLYIPWSNTWGASAGLIAGVGVVGWLTVGAQIAAEAGQRVSTVLHTYTHNCPPNMTLTHFTTRNGGDAFVLYRISFLWYSLLSAGVSFFVGMVVSFATNTNKANLNTDTTIFQPDEAPATELLLYPKVVDSKALKMNSKGNIFHS